MLSSCQPFCIHTEDKFCFLRSSSYSVDFIPVTCLSFSWCVFIRQSHGSVEQLFELSGSGIPLVAFQGLGARWANELK